MRNGSASTDTGSGGNFFRRNSSNERATNSTAGISGIAGNTAVRTGDAETGLQRIFDADKVQREINAQVAITQAFSREAPKAVAKFSDGQIADLKKDLANETDKTKQDALKGEIDKWGEGGRYRVLLHTLAGGFSGGASGALGAAASASAASLMNQLQDGIASSLQTAGLSTDVAKGIASGIAGLTAAGVGAAVGGVQGAATAATVDFNNRQLHPTERQRAADLATLSKGKGNFTKEQIEEQMRLMGNVAFGVGPNTPEVLTTKQDIDSNNVVDPGMPKVSDRVATVEILGKANPEIQQFIIANTKDGAGYIPGASPYQPSNWALNKPATTNTPPVDAVQTARCANSDLACRSGVGVQQSVPMTLAQQQAVGDYFGNMSTQYQRMAALATATGNAPVVLSFEIAAGVTGLLEQAFKPSAGKVLVDSFLIDTAADTFARRTGIPRAMVFEVVEREVKPKFQALRNSIDIGTGTLK